MGITSTNRMPLKELAMMCRRVGVSLDAGIDIRKIWENESRRGTSSTANHAEEVRAQVAAGGSLFEALESCGEFYPPLLRKLVRVGERAGKLDLIFQQLADHYEHSIQLRKFFLSQLTWPLIELFIALFVVGLLIWILGFTGTDVLGWGLIGTTGVLKYLAILFTIGCLGFAAFQVVRRVIGLGVVIQWFTRLPVVGGFIQVFGLARFAWVLGLATNTDTPVRSSVEMALDATMNPYFTSHQAEIDSVIVNGSPIHEAILPTDSFPVEFVDAVKVGEDTGMLSESMLRLAKAYDDQVRSQSKIITTIGGFAVWGIVAMFIIAMIFRLAMFYVGTISNAVNMTM